MSCFLNGDVASVRSWDDVSLCRTLILRSDNLVSSTTKAVKGLQVSRADDADGLEAMLLLVAEMRRRLDEDAASPAADDEVEPNAPDERAWDRQRLFQEILEHRVFNRLLAVLPRFHFEGGKDVMWLFTTFMRCAAQSQDLRELLVGFSRDLVEVARLLLRGLREPEVTMICGQMLREFGRFAELVKLISQDANAFMELLDITKTHSSFDVALDSFATLKELILSQKEVSNRVLQSNFDEFFDAMHALLEECDYIIQRQGLRFLGEILMDPNFLEVMIEYVERSEFLRLHMNILREASDAVRLGAFHLLKIFIGNPNMAGPIRTILARNASKLNKIVGFLPRLRPEDEALVGDVRLVESCLAALPKTQKRRSPSDSSQVSTQDSSAEASSPSTCLSPRTSKSPSTPTTQTRSSTGANTQSHQATATAAAHPTRASAVADAHPPQASAVADAHSSQPSAAAATTAAAAADPEAVAGDAHDAANDDDNNSDKSSNVEAAAAVAEAAAALALPPPDDAGRMMMTEKKPASSLTSMATISPPLSSQNTLASGGTEEVSRCGNYFDWDPTGTISFFGKVELEMVDLNLDLDRDLALRELATGQQQQ